MAFSARTYSSLLNGPTLILIFSLNTGIYSYQLKGGSQKERLENWYNHFQTLLGNPPDIEDEDEEIPIIVENLDIKEGHFSHDEYAQAKSAIVEGQVNGEDGILPEVLKRCDVDDIILYFVIQH